MTTVNPANLVSNSKPVLSPIVTNTNGTSYGSGFTGYTNSAGNITPFGGKWEDDRSPIEKVIFFITLISPTLRCVDRI
jgi:hypothetical protein